jgi:hypothetical protein
MSNNINNYYKNKKKSKKNTLNVWNKVIKIILTNYNNKNLIIFFNRNKMNFKWFKSSYMN